MTRVALSKRWTRAIAAAGLVLILHAGSPARAEVAGVAAQVDVQTLPLPARGTHRLVRIGPQAVVSEDDHGRVTMADEPVAEPRRGQVLSAVTAMLGLVGFGGFLWLEGGEPGITLKAPAALPGLR